MSDTLQQLVIDRLAALDLSLRAAWLRLPDDQQGRRAISYETVRRIRENGHTTISDTTADALALMLGVSADDIHRAAGHLPRLGRFELPTRADRLTLDQRRTVIAVIDTILEAAQTHGSS